MGITHRQTKKALTPLQKGGSNPNQPVNTQLPEFPFKRVDSDLFQAETDTGLTNISLIPEEIMVRSRGSGAPGIQPQRNQTKSEGGISIGGGAGNIPNNRADNNNNSTGSIKKSSITDHDDDSVASVNHVSSN